MNISSTLHYSRSFSGFVWRIKLDEVTCKLWLEVRDESTFEISLFWVDLKNGEEGQFPSNGSLGWWDGIVHAYDDILCIQHMKDTTNPGPVDLKIINARNTTESRIFSDLIIEVLHANHLEVVIEGDKQIIELCEFKDLHSDKLLMPQVYPEGHQYHDIVKGFLADKREGNISGPIMYLEDESIFIVYHVKQNDIISRRLVCIKNDKIVLEELIDEKMTGYSNESFFTFSNYLIFIENRRTVKVYSK